MIDIAKLKQDYITCTIDRDERKIFISGIDSKGILSHIVGLINLQGLSIIHAESRTELVDDVSVFEDVFTIEFRESREENWFEYLPKLIEEQTKLVYKHKRKDALQNILEKISDYISRKKIEPKSPIVSIDIEELKQHTLKISIQGEDTPFLLYMLSTSLEFQDLFVEKFFIDTQKNYVEDVFFVKTEKTLGEVEIRTLRLKLMLHTQFTFYLKQSPDPYQAFVRFQDIVKNIKKENLDNFITFLQVKDKRKAELAAFLGSGDYLWEDFARIYSSEIAKLYTNTQITQEEQAETLETELSTLLEKEQGYEKKVIALNKFKDEKIFSVDINNLINEKQDFKILGQKLSELAKTIVRQASSLIEEKLQESYGTPRSSIGHKSDWALFALGKFGGSALGYASDIELLFIYEDEGKTDGEVSVSNREYFEMFVQELKKIIIAHRDGIFQLDLRLRPHGDAGPQAVRISSFMEYYQSPQAHSIELLSLTRMRPIAGDPRLAERVLRILKSILYRPDPIDVESIFDMRKKQVEEKVKPGTRNAKFSSGALVDVEYSVQILQLSYGKDRLELQQPNIYSTLVALKSIGEISEEDAELLLEAYVFFRRLINALRMRRGNAKDLALPEEQSWELEHLARRMSYVGDELSCGEKLMFDFDKYSVGVKNLQKKLFGNLLKNFNDEITNPGELVYVEDISRAKTILRNIDKPEEAFHAIKKCSKNERTQHLFSQVLLLGWVRILRRGEANLVLLTFQHIAETLSAEHLAEFYKKLLKQPKSLSVLIDVFTTSRYLSEEIIKKPEYLFYFLDLKDIQREKTLEAFRESLRDYIAHLTPQDELDEKNILREFKKREMIRIIIRDICIQAPLQNVCAEISDLAQVIVQQAFGFSAQRQGITQKGIAIFAFGKLGSRELNYSSDIDLVCVCDEKEHKTQEGLIKLFRNTIQILTDYTSSGMAYRVDIRLRPHGESGDIVCSLQSFEDYYKNQAQIWEIQAGIKFSQIAGDEAFGSRCVRVLRETSKLRLAAYTSEEILEDIHRLRTRSVDTHIKNKDEEYLEVKNSWGGIRDIEFSIQGLMLIHYENDLAREKQTSLQALRLLHKNQIIDKTHYEQIRSHYLFLRRVEHFLQVYEDKQLHSIPLNDPSARKRLAWLLLEEPDEDSFMNRLKKVKKEVSEWYRSIYCVEVQN